MGKKARTKWTPVDWTPSVAPVPVDTHHARDRREERNVSIAEQEKCLAEGVRRRLPDGRCLVHDEETGVMLITNGPRERVVFSVWRRDGRDQVDGSGQWPELWQSVVSVHDEDVQRHMATLGRDIGKLYAACR